MNLSPEYFYKLLGPRTVLLQIPLGQKGPIDTGWNNKTFEDTQSEPHFGAINSAFLNGGNIGIRLGSKSDNLCTIDCDTDEIAQWILEHNPRLQNTFRTVGARGCQFWIRIKGDYPDKVYKLRSTDKESLKLEWRGDSQSVVYGVHPDTHKQYTRTDNPPVEILFKDIIWPGDADLPWQSNDKPNGSKGVSGANIKSDTAWTSRFKGDFSTLNLVGILERLGCEVKGQEGQKTHVKCPWSEEHSIKDQKKDATIWRDGEWPSFHCQHSHCEGRGLEQVLDWAESRCLGIVDDHCTKHRSTRLESKLHQEEQQRQEAEESIDVNELREPSRDQLSRYLSDPEPFPQSMHSDGYYGLLGDTTAIMAEQCEASKEVLFMHGLIIIGSMIGRSAYAYAGSPLFTNEFAVFVGDTAKGRKGTGLSMWEQFVFTFDDDWLKNCISKQNQSGEGIVHRVRDERWGFPPGKKKKGEEIAEVLLDAGVADKRLMIVEEEFSHTLKMSQRSGNTVTEILRNAWESRQFINTTNKNSPLIATNAHISLIGHTTRAELISLISSTDVDNGMANRILWVAAKREKLLPDVEPIEWIREHTSLVHGWMQVLKQEHLDKDTPKKFSRSTTEAKAYWDFLYRKFNEEKQDGLVDTALARDTSHLLKIALIFAITDGVQQIDKCHLEAAVHVIDYCKASARWVFGKATGNNLADNILWSLRHEPNGMSRNSITIHVCNRNRSRSEIDQALACLVKNRLAFYREIPGKKGKEAEWWFAE